MAVSIKHKFVNPKSNTADATVTRASNWNDDHNITMASGHVLGRSTAANGPVEELTPQQLRTVGDVPQLGVLGGVNTRTASYTLVASDRGKVIEMNVASANTVTVPGESGISGVNFPIGTEILVVQTGAGPTTLIPAGGVTLRAGSTGLSTVSQYSALALYKRGANDWLVVDQSSGYLDARLDALEVLNAVYQGAHVTDPTLRNNGNALGNGDIYFNTSTNRLRSYANGVWYDTGPGGSTDAALVSYTSSGTGAVARTTQARLREVMSVKDFGAIGNGIANDTTALQTAINAAAAAQVQLFWPKGTYLISTTLNIPTKSNWKGEGGGYSIIKGDGIIRFLVSNTTTAVEDIVIDGLGFDINGYNAVNFGSAMVLNGLSHTRIRITNNRVFDSNYPGDLTVKQRQGLFVGNRPLDVWVLNNDFSNGFRIKVGRGGKNIFIKNNKLQTINDNAITMAMDGTVASPTGDFAENVHIEDNIILDAFGNGIFVGADGPDILDPTLYIKNISISRNIIYYNNSQSEVLQTPRFVLLNVPQNNASDININDNICVMTSNVISTGSGIAGIHITGGSASTTLSRLSISRNRVVCPYKRESAIYFGAAGTINDVTIADNDMDGYSESIWIQTATTINRLTVTGNISRNMDRGFRLDSGPVVNSGLYARNRVFSPTAACAFANTASAMTWRVENNEILNSSAYAVEISGAGTKNFVIINNDFRGAALGPVRIFSSAVLSDISARYDNLGDNAIFEITSASTLTLPNARFVSVGGTTNIDNITTTGRAGHVVTLVFGGVLTVNDGTGNLNLAGNFTTTANDTLTLACSGNTWFEVARSVN